MRTAEDTPAELAYQTYGVLDEARCKAQEALDAAEHRADLAKALLDSTLYTIGTGPQSRPQVRRRVGKAVRLLASYEEAEREALALVPSAAQAKAAADIAWMRANTLSQIEKWEG